MKEEGYDVVGTVGQKYDRFPLLVKIIDAGKRLSLQVHPDEAAHHRQIHKMIGESYREKIASWPFRVEKDFFGHRVVFCHYARINNKFVRPIVNPTVDELDDIFGYIDAEVIFFGHEHHPLTAMGKKL